MEAVEKKGQIFAKPTQRLIDDIAIGKRSPRGAGRPRGHTPHWKTLDLRMTGQTIDSTTDDWIMGKKEDTDSHQHP